MTTIPALPAAKTIPDNCNRWLATHVSRSLRAGLAISFRRRDWAHCVAVRASPYHSARACNRLGLLTVATTAHATESCAFARVVGSLAHNAHQVGMHALAINNKTLPAIFAAEQDAKVMTCTSLEMMCDTGVQVSAK